MGEPQCGENDARLLFKFEWKARGQRREKWVVSQFEIYKAKAVNLYPELGLRIPAK